MGVLNGDGGGDGDGCRLESSQNHEKLLLIRQ